MHEEMSTEDASPGSGEVTTAQVHDQASTVVEDEVPKSHAIVAFLDISQTREAQEAEEESREIEAVQNAQEPQSNESVTQEQSDVPEEGYTPQPEEETQQNLEEEEAAVRHTEKDSQNTDEVAMSQEVVATLEISETGEAQEAEQKDFDNEAAQTPAESETITTTQADEQTDEIPSSQEIAATLEISETREAQDAEGDNREIEAVQNAQEPQSNESVTQEQSDVPEEGYTPQPEEETQQNLEEEEEAVRHTEKDSQNTDEVAMSQEVVATLEISETGEAQEAVHKDPQTPAESEKVTTIQADEQTDEVPSSQELVVTLEISKAREAQEEEQKDFDNEAAQTPEEGETIMTTQADDQADEVPKNHAFVAFLEISQSREAHEAEEENREIEAGQEPQCNESVAQEQSDVLAEGSTPQEQNLEEEEEAVGHIETNSQDAETMPDTAEDDQGHSHHEPDQEPSNSTNADEEVDRLVSDAGANVDEENRQRVNRLVSDAGSTAEEDRQRVNRLVSDAGSTAEDQSGQRVDRLPLSVTREELMDMNMSYGGDSPTRVKAMEEGRVSPPPMKATWGLDEHSSSPAAPIREQHGRVLQNPPERRTYTDEESQRSGGASPRVAVADVDFDKCQGHIPEANEDVMLELRDLAMDMLESRVRISSPSKRDTADRQTYVRPESAQRRRELGERQAYLGPESGHSARSRPESGGGQSSVRSRPESAHSRRPRSAARPLSAHHRRRNQEKELERRPLEEMGESGRLSAATTRAPTASPSPLNDADAHWRELMQSGVVRQRDGSGEHGGGCADDDDRQERVTAGEQPSGTPDKGDDFLDASDETMQTPAQSIEWGESGRRRRTRRQLSASAPEALRVAFESPASPSVDLDSPSSQHDLARTVSGSPYQEQLRIQPSTRVRAGSRRRNSPTMRSDIWMEEAEEGDSGIVDLDDLSPPVSGGGERRRRRRRGARGPTRSTSPTEMSGPRAYSSMPMPQRAAVSLSVERQDETASPSRSIPVYPRVSEAMTKAFVFGPLSPPARRRVYVDPQRPTTPGHRDRFAVTCTGPGPAAYYPHPETLADSSRHPRPGRTVFRHAAAGFMVGLNSDTPAPGTYSVVAQAGGSSRAMRCFPTRSSPSAAFSKDPRVCTLGGGMGIKSKHSSRNADRVRYDDIRVTPFRDWH